MSNVQCPRHVQCTYIYRRLGWAPNAPAGLRSIFPPFNDLSYPPSLTLTLTPPFFFFPVLCLPLPLPLRLSCPALPPPRVKREEEEEGGGGRKERVAAMLDAQCSMLFSPHFISFTFLFFLFSFLSLLLCILHPALPI